MSIHNPTHARPSGESALPVVTRSSAPMADRRTGAPGRGGPGRGAGAVPASVAIFSSIVPLGLGSKRAIPISPPRSPAASYADALAATRHKPL